MDKKLSSGDVAIVGGETLLGRDVLEVLESESFPATVSLVSSVDEEGHILTAVVDEAAVMIGLNSAEFASTNLVFLAGAPEASVKAAQVVSTLKLAPILIDLTGGLEDRPEARLRAPTAEPPEYRATSPIQVIAHPASIAIATFLRQLDSVAQISRAVIDIFEPVSERGRAGIEELRQQTVALLSFKTLNKDVFEAQVSFNLLPRFGEDAPQSLATVESKIERHLASLLSSAKRIPMPSLRLIHAPVFHGYSFSIWVEFEKNPGVEALSAGLKSARIDVRGKDEEPPSNVGAAGQSGVTVGAIAADRNNARACWFWMAADNFRVAAENAVEVAREVFA